MGHAGSTGAEPHTALHAAAAAALQHGTEPARRRHKLSSPPAPRMRGWTWNADAPGRLQRWQAAEAYHAYHEGGCGPPF